MLMGLPVARTKVMVYTMNGFCSALAGVVFSIYMLSGYGLYTNGLELEAIAAVVIGGTMLTGGVGYVIGTVFGVLIQGLIQTLSCSRALSTLGGPRSSLDCYCWPSLECRA